MARQKTRLPQAAEDFLAGPEGRWCRPVVRLLHRWMNARALLLSDLTPVHLEQFWSEQEGSGYTAATLHTRRCRLHKYLYWLGDKGLLRFSVAPARLRHMGRALPQPARRFLAHPENKLHEPVVRNLHDWLERCGISLAQLTPIVLNHFLQRPIATTIAKTSREDRHRRLEPYLKWLYEQGLVSLRLDRRVRKPSAIPDCAKEFIDTLRPVLKKNTCAGYVVDLRDLHAWLDARKIALHDVDRRAAERWLGSLADRGLAPVTRNYRILHARAYLRWLAERGDFDRNPDELLRAEDLPKIPSYLPRPFPPEVDIELQRRFRSNDNVYGQALFLMRRSGMRIGELVRLEPRCLDEDLRENVFIKVPLGKLDNERLVPLDSEAREVAEHLLRLCPDHATFLIEPNLGRDTVIKKLRETLADAAKGLDIPGPVVSHRLRHTYATQLLNAGMSLVGVMKLLGHRSLRMTMRYAAVTQETVVNDYFKAMSKISARYEIPKHALERSLADSPDPDRMLRDVISYLRNAAPADPNASRLITRIHKLRYEIAHLENQPPAP
jgi:site-specific recombinase XerD